MHSQDVLASSAPDAGSDHLSPGARIGVLGSGQLGRMLAMAAQRLGLQVHVFSPHVASPAGQVANVEMVGDYDDADAMKHFAKNVDVLTLEFENVPKSAVDVAARYVPTRPNAHVLHTVQNRLREKRFLTDHAIPCADYVAVDSLEQLRDAVKQLGFPAVLKTADSGYDGKGQMLIQHDSDTETAWRHAGEESCVLERFVTFQHELSVLVARSPHGDMAVYPPIVNEHRNHILDISIAHHPEVSALAGTAQDLAQRIAAKLKMVGLLCVEFFATENGQLLVNEIAPRPHNSGHLTIDAAVTCQFEQQARSVCGMPLGSTEILRPAAMANLLGDLWSHGSPRWEAALAIPDVKLHLYGKAEARPGRKMGHLTATADTAARAEQRVRAARDALLATQ